MAEEREKQIMVVDDDEDILFTVRSIFKKRGIPILTAKGGKECLALMEKGFRGVILMDIMMPEMDGWDTVQGIVDRGLINDVIISMFTAKDVPDTKMEHLKEYILDYITKPFEPEHLVDIVDDYLDLLD